MQGAQQAAEALQAGFDGGAPAPGVHALEAAVNHLLAREHETRYMYARTLRVLGQAVGGKRYLGKPRSKI